jgi:hypothetical protein
MVNNYKAHFVDRDRTVRVKLTFAVTTLFGLTACNVNEELRGQKRSLERKLGYQLYLDKIEDIGKTVGL